MALSLLKSQIVPLIEKFEPELQGILTKTIQSLKDSKPEEAKVFYSNWKLLNSAIEKEFAAEPTPPPVAPAPVMGGAVDLPAPVPDVPPQVSEASGPTGPVTLEASGPSFTQESGASGPTIIQRITEFFSTSGPTGPITAGERKFFAPNGGSYKGGKRRHGKTAKQHRKRTHRVKHRKQ